jgi:hypothetical protein
MKLIQPISFGLLASISFASTALATPNATFLQRQNGPQFKQAESQPVHRTSQPQPSSGLGGSKILGTPCPKGQVHSSWQKPIYDANGLFVVGWETVYTCIPADLEPQG